MSSVDVIKKLFKHLRGVVRPPDRLDLAPVADCDADLWCRLMLRSYRDRLAIAPQSDLLVV